MKQRVLIIIQNLSKSGSPLTFLHVIKALKTKYDIDVAVARVNDPKIDLEFLDEYKKNVSEIFLLNIKSYTLINRLFPYHAYKPLLKYANDSKYSFVICNIFEVGALLVKNQIAPKTIFYSLDRLSLDSKYKIVNRRKKKMFDYLGKSDCFIALTSNCYYDWFDLSQNNHFVLLDYPDIELKLDPKRFHDNKIVLGIIGYYCDKKNQLFALSLLKKMNDSGINTYLNIMGYYFDNDRSYFNKMIDFINQNNLQNRVIFTDKNYDKKLFFENIDVLLCPSHYEGLGLVILESQYRKTPCVASDVLPKESQIGLASFCSLDKQKTWIEAINNCVQNRKAALIDENLAEEFDFKLLRIIETIMST